MATAQQTHNYGSIFTSQSTYVSSTDSKGAPHVVQTHGAIPALSSLTFLATHK